MSVVRETMSHAAAEGGSWFDWPTVPDLGMDAILDATPTMPTSLFTLGGETGFDLAPGRDVATPVASSTKPDTPELEPSKAAELGVGLKGGSLIGSLSKQFDLAGIAATVGGALDLANGRLAGQFGLEKDGFGANVGAGVDVDADGSVAAMTANAEVQADEAKVGLGGGTVDRTVLTEKDGMFTVTRQQGAAAHATLGMKGVGGGTKNSLAQSTSRTFDTKEEAEAYQTELEAAEHVQTTFTSEDLGDMEPGESLSHSMAGEAGVDAGFGVTGGVGAKLENTKDIECVKPGVFKVTSSSDWDVKGTLGLANPIAGVEGFWSPWGAESSSEMEFDLNKPGVAEVFDEFQRTGKLPEELPDGVLQTDAKDVSTEEWGTVTTAGPDKLERSRRTEDGTTGVGADQERFSRGTAEEKHTRQLIGEPELIAREKHQLTLRGEDPSMQTNSEYEGQDALAKLAAHVDPNLDLNQARQQFGPGGGHFEVEGRYAPGTMIDLSQRIWDSALNPKSEDRLMAYDSGHDDQMMARLTAGVCGESEASHADASLAFADLAAREGRSGLNLIEKNVKNEQFHVRDLGAGSFPGHRAIQENEHLLTELEEAGTLNPEAYGQATETIQAQIDAVYKHWNELPEGEARLKMERLHRQLDRLIEVAP